MSLRVRDRYSLTIIRCQTHFHQCSAKFPEIGCSMFSNDMSKTATTMSLSILVGEPWVRYNAEGDG